METRNIIVKTEGDHCSARLDAVESCLSALEKVVDVAVAKMLPKVDKLLTQMTLEEETTMEVRKPTAASPSTSLFEMAEKGDHEALLGLAADMNLDFNQYPERNDYGDTPLHVAAKAGNMTAVVVLLGLGENINCQGYRLRTPLHCAVAQGHLAVAQRLLIAGAKVNVKDADDVTPLGLVAGKGNRDFLDILLEKGACPDEMELFMAAKNGHWEIVEWMLEKRGMFSPIWRYKEKDPLIVLACKANVWRMVKRLLEKGASATNCKTDRESALVWASQAGQADVVQLLLRHGAASHPKQIRWALMATRSADVVKAFVAEVPDLIRGELGELGLVCAGSHDRVETLRVYLEAGVDVNTKDRVGVPVLSRATCHGNIACVKILLENGARVNITDRSRDSPLHVASSKGQVECLRVLLEAGARTTKKNVKGETPLDVASSYQVRRVLCGK